MIMILLTKAQDGAALQKELRNWRATVKRNPAFIVAPHDLPYALTNDPKYTTDDTGNQDSYDGVRLICLCELWEIEAVDLSCEDRPGGRL
jgi:hypothetical protein